MPNEDSNNDIVNSANAAASLSDAVERMEIDRHGRATSVLPAVLPKLKQRTSPNTQPSSPPLHDAHTTKQDVSQPTETPPLLVEELTSSLQTIQSISEQLTVESEATSLLSLLSQTEESIQGLLAASTSNSPKAGHKKGPGKWLGLKRQRSPTGIEKEVNNALGALRDTTQSVKELHVATLERQFKRSVALGALQYVRNIKSAIDELGTQLEPSSANSNVQSQILHNFVTRASKWLRVSDSPVIQPIAPKHLPLAAGSSFTSAVASSSSSASSSALPTPLLSGSVANGPFSSSSTDSCPLETALRNSNIFGRATGTLQGFISWATREKSFSDVHSLVGPIRSVHLFREREAPLHHEFALVSFAGRRSSTTVGSVAGSDGRSGGAVSWLRVERAALLKSSSTSKGLGKFIPKWDSFGPVFSGAPLRETVRIAGKKDELVGRAMELASAVIPSRDTEVHDTDTNQDVNIETKLKAYNPVYLDEFGKLLLNTSENRPQYQLLTANCRWFARSTLLNVAGRLSQHPLSEQTWNGLDHIPFDVLKKNLLNDPFGGKQLEGPRANLLAFANQLESLAASLIKGQPIAVINGFEEGVDKGETLIGKLEQLVRSASGSNQESDPDRRIYLLAYANYIYGTANRLLSHLNEAAVLLQRSRELLDPLQAASNDHSLLYLDVLTGLGSVAHSQKQYPSARDVRASVVEHWRARYNVSATSTDFDSAMGLARALGFYARSLAVIRSTTPTRDPLHRPEALDALQEAEKLARATYEVRSDLAHELLAWVLSQKAGALSDISEDGPEMQSALDAASEAVELTRPLYKANHAMMRRSFASRLRLKADLARKLLQFEAACEAGTEVLPVIRVEYGIAPRTYAADLQNAMNDLIRDVRKLEEGPQASDVARAAIQEMRAVIASLKELVISSDVQNTELGSGEQHAVHKAVYLVLVELFAHMLVRVAKGPVASAAFIVQGENSLVKEHKVLKSELATYGKVYNGHPKIVRTF